MQERNLDGIYIRVERDGKWHSLCLTDCTWEEVTKWLRQEIRPADFYEAIIKELHECLRGAGDTLDISR